MKQLFFLAIILFSSAVIWAQQVQTIRGHVIDKESKTSLPGANVVLLNVEPLTGTVTDNDGNFRLDKVAVGRQSIQVIG